MKKIRLLSLFMALLLSFQPVCAPAQAAQTTEAPQTTGTATQPQGPVAMEEPVPTTAELSFGQVCVQNGCRTIEAMVPLAGTEPKLASAMAVFLYEANTDTVVYAFNPDTKLPPGNLAKLVTGIVALQFCDMDDQVTVAEGIKGRLPGGAITMNLTNNETLTVRDLLHGLILTDASDAAVALAEHISGSRQNFVPLMNEWVKSIGCTNTEFGTVHGVDGNASVTTARDVARIVREATKNEDFAEVFNAATYTVPATNVNKDARKLKTLNYMRDTGVIEQFYDKRILGGMASYEATSKACLVTTSESQNMHYIAVVLGCNRIFSTEKSWQPQTYGNFEEMAELLKFGYNNYKVNRIVYDDMCLSQFAVEGGECNAAGRAKVNIDSVVPNTAQMKNLTTNYTLLGSKSGRNLSAPIQEGEKIATVELWYRNSCLAEAEVFAMGAVKRSDDTGVKIHSVAGSADAGGSGFWNVVGTVCVIGLGLAAGYLALNSYMRARSRARHRRRRVERRRSRG